MIWALVAIVAFNAVLYVAWRLLGSEEYRAEHPFFTNPVKLKPGQRANPFKGRPE